MPPMWFTLARLCIGFVTVFFLLAFQKQIALPKKKDLPFILSIGLLQMACFLIFLNGGLLLVNAGRAAILVYSTPFLVAPIAILYFKEKYSLPKLLGLILGFAGILILFNPWSFDWHNEKALIGNGLLLLAAACWAIAMLHTRYGVWHTSSYKLIPWQLLLATVFVLISCLIIDPHPKIIWTRQLITMMLFNGLFATGFAYAACIFITQRLPVINTSLLLLGVPVLGLLASAWWLNEPLSLYIFISLACILTGLVCLALDRPRK